MSPLPVSTPAPVTADPGRATTSLVRRDTDTTNTFLRILVAQLQTQNPLEPQNGTEFITQLAQFNTLEQLMAIRAELQAIRQATGRNPS